MAVNGNGNGNGAKSTDTIKTWGLVGGYILSMVGIIVIPCLAHPGQLLSSSEDILGQIVIVSLFALAGLRATSEVTSFIAILIKLRQGNGVTPITPPLDPASIPVTDASAKTLAGASPPTQQ